MAGSIGCYFKTGGIETGGTNALTGLVSGGTRISVADAETSRAVLAQIGVVYTLYYRCEDDATFEDVGQDSSATVTITAPSGTQVCSTWNGSFAASATMPAAVGAFQPVYIKRTAVDSSTPNLEVGTDGVTFTAGSRVGQVGTVTPTPLVGGTSISLDWADVTAADGYQVDRSTASDFATYTRTASATSNATITGLTFGTLYYFRVRAYDERGVGAFSSTASATASLYDDFEGGTDGAALGTRWSIVAGSAANNEHDNVHALGTLAAWLEAAAGSTPYLEAVSTSMTPSGCEMRFAMYLPDATHFRQVLTHNSFAWFALDAAGNIRVITDRTATGYTTGNWTTVGAYAAGWLYVRLVYDVANDTYQLSTRTSEGSGWTPRKASGASDYNIPGKATSNLTSSGKLRFTCSDGDQVWIDNVQCAVAGLA